MKPNPAEALALPAKIGDPRERALVEQVIATIQAGGKLPSWASMTPLMRVAARFLLGGLDAYTVTVIRDDAPETPSVFQVTGINSVQEALTGAQAQLSEALAGAQAPLSEAWTRQQVMAAWEQVANRYYEDCDLNDGTGSAYDYRMTTLIQALLAELEKGR